MSDTMLEKQLLIRARQDFRTTRMEARLWAAQYDSTRDVLYNVHLATAIGWASA